MKWKRSVAVIIAALFPSLLAQPANVSLVQVGL
jgi:hypothetical protein